jgi:hypothetical protein
MRPVTVKIVSRFTSIALILLAPLFTTASTNLSDYQTEIAASTTLKAYWKLDNDYTDSSGNSNTFTAVNNPTFSTSVPFTAGNLNQTTALQAEMVSGTIKADL